MSLLLLETPEMIEVIVQVFANFDWAGKFL